MNESKMSSRESIGKLAIINVILGCLFLAVWTLVTFSGSRPYRSPGDISSYHHGHIEVDKLPRLSADKRTLVVTSEDALPTAFEFLRLNMYLPIQKIVLMKPGANDTVRVYPIPRDGMIGLSPSSDLSLSISEIILVCLFLIFILGSFAYIFTSISGSRLYWDEEGWISNDELCFDLSGDDDITEDEKEKAKKKQRLIELEEEMKYNLV